MSEEISEALQEAQETKKRKVSDHGNNGRPAHTTSATTTTRSTKTSGYHLSKQACVACRQRKIRCNAQQPCSYCASKNKDCVYGPAFKRAQCAQAASSDVNNQYGIERWWVLGRHVDVLEAKVREYERPRPPQDDRPNVPHTSPSAVPETSGRKSNSNGSQAGFRTDRGAADPPPSPSSHKPIKRYGKSSSLHFALHVKASAMAMSDDAGHAQNGQPQNADGEDADDGEEEWLVEYRGQSPGMSQLLPYRHVAKALFEKYFETVHPIWPFLLENESRESFSNTWMSDEPPDPLWMVQLNLIMCLGCQQYESEPDGTHKLPGFDATSSGEDFYQRAQGYVYANAFTASNVRMLQALLLMALYQQGAMRFNECYLTVGLGLLRVLLSIYRVLTISSSLYGRPVGIPYGQFSDYQDLLPQQVDDSHIALGQSQPTDAPSINSFFRHSVRLYHVMDHVLLRLRNAKKTAYFDLVKASADVQIQTPVSNVNAMSSLLVTILQLDGYLLSWHEYLPPHLRFSLDGPDDTPPTNVPWIQRQKHCLRSRFFGMRMLLHRQTILFLLQPSERRNWPQNGIQEWPPLFSDCYSDTLVGGSTPIRRQGIPSPVETTLTHLSARICVESAVSQIEAMERLLNSERIGDWWDFNCKLAFSPWVESTITQSYIYLVAMFNAICVLSGAMALHRQDLTVVLPESSKTYDVIQRGFAMIQRTSTNPGLASNKLRQSEQLLEKLVQEIVERKEKVRFHKVTDARCPDW
ncbi:MAG: hypothetical protein Q9201_004083 [Fulgogasparrea decipioides]